MEILGVENQYPVFFVYCIEFALPLPPADQRVKSIMIHAESVVINSCNKQPANNIKLKLGPHTVYKFLELFDL